MSLPDIETQQSRLSNVVADVLEQAAKLGATQAEAAVSAGSGLSLTVRKRDVETLEFHRDQSLGVTVYIGQRKGNASTSDLNPESIAETVCKACSLASYGAEDEFAGLADAKRMATEFPDLDLYHPWHLEPDAAIDLATECESAALDFDTRINNSEGASVSSYEGVSVYGNSHGFFWQAAPRVSTVCRALCWRVKAQGCSVILNLPWLVTLAIWNQRMQ